MKSYTFAVLALLAAASAEEGSHWKRSPLGSQSSSGASYTKSSAGSSGQQAQKGFSPSQVQYASQPPEKLTASSSPVGFGGAQQYDFQAPSFGKSFAAPQSSPYSPASDVSSFTFNSPAVQYNSLGYLHQLAGKLSAAAPQPDQAQQFYTPSAGKFASFAAPAAAGPVTFASSPQKYSFATPGSSFQGGSFGGGRLQFAAPPQQVVYSQQGAFVSAPQHPSFQSFAGGLQGAQSQAAYAVAPSQYDFAGANKYAGYAAQ